MKSVTEIVYTLTYTSHDGVKAEAAAAPVDDAITAPAEDNAPAPATETTATVDTPAATTADDTSAPKTGIVLAVLPMAIAATAVAVSKKR